MNFKCRFRSIISLILLKTYFPKVIFKIIKNPQELEKVYELTWQIYGVEKKYIDTTRFSPKIFKDKYEKHSTIVGAFLKDNLIGALRIIYFSPLGFYINEDFNVDIPSSLSSEAVEISRLVVLKEYRKKGLISFGLLKKALELSIQKKKKFWLVVISKNLKTYFEKSYGVKIYPLKVKELTEKQYETRSKMINYYKMLNPLPYIISLKEIY